MSKTKSKKKITVKTKTVPAKSILKPKSDPGFIKGFISSGLPHLLLCPEKNPGWQRLRNAYDQARLEVENSGADVLVIYSTYWSSILGHQIQAFPEPEWVHVDDLFHDLGSISYKFKIDSEFAELYKTKAKERGLHARTTAYEGFPIDTGSIVALKLLNPNNKIPAVIVSSNIYSDRAETLVLGKAARDALIASNKKGIAISVTSLSNRLHNDFIDPRKDKIHSLKDEEWNRKFLDYLSLGRLEDCSQLSRQFHKEARVQKVVNFKPFWWLAAAMGQNNLYTGKVYEYQPVMGTGNCLVGLTPTTQAARDLEFDEDDPQKYVGERNVLGARHGL